MKIAKNLHNLLFRRFSPVWWVRKFSYLSLALREACERRNWESPQDSNDSEISNLNREGFLSINFWGDEVTSVIDYCLQLSEKLDPLNQAPSQSEGKDFWRLLVAGEEVADHPILRIYSAGRRLHQVILVRKRYCRT
jgi:hypothetical protein